MMRLIKRISDSVGCRVSFIAISFILAMTKPTLAGRLPEATDAFPEFVSIDILGKDIRFTDQWGESYWLRGADWNRWSAPLQSNKKRRTPIERGLSCTIPKAVLDRYRNEVFPAKEIACDGGHIWFASSSYCAEGAKEQGRLFSYDTASAAVTVYDNFTPRCEAIVGIARMGDHLWLASVTPGEYGSYDGKGILVYDLKSRRRIATEPAATMLTDNLLYAIAYQPEAKAIWVTTLTGIDRYSLKTRTWEHRFFDVAITPDNHLQIILSPQPPTPQRVWMAYHLYYYPIEDLQGFARVWDAIEIKNPSWLVKDPRLLPYYISALWNMDETWNDYTFVAFLKEIASIKGSEDQILAVLDRLNKQPLSQHRRTAVVELRQKFGLPQASEDMDRQFELLRDRYFTQGIGLYDLCNFSFAHTEYLKRLNDFFVTKPYVGEVDDVFMDDCVRAYSNWRGAEAFLPSIQKALAIDNARMAYASCSVFNHYAKETFRAPEMVLPVLEARYRSKRLSGTWGEPNKKCAMASYWVTNSIEGINTLLAKVEHRPELIPLAEDVLQELTGEHLKGLPAWRNWWTSHRKDFKPNKKVYYWSENR